MLPPLQMTATLWPANRCGPASTAAGAAAAGGVLAAIDAALGNAPVKDPTLALLAQEGVLRR
jgi:hypothetical protein